MRQERADRSVVASTRGSGRDSPLGSFRSLGLPRAGSRFVQLARNGNGRKDARGCRAGKGEEEGEKEERERKGDTEKEKIGRAGLPALPHKYGFSRAVYDRKRVEPRERSRA